LVCIGISIQPNGKSSRIKLKNAEFPDRFGLVRSAPRIDTITATGKAYAVWHTSEETPERCTILEFNASDMNVHASRREIAIPEDRQIEDVRVSPNATHVSLLLYRKPKAGTSKLEAAELWVCQIDGSELTMVSSSVLAHPKILRGQDDIQAMRWVPDSRHLSVVHEDRIQLIRMK
jgi:hypothetical protein